MASQVVIRSSLYVNLKDDVITFLIEDYRIHPISVPSAGPSNIIAMKNSSSSIVVTWDDVPADHQNGIITGYRVYIRRNGSDGDWSQEDTSNKRWSKSGLDLWTFYDIKISGKTSVGEGVQGAAVSVRTDEDGK